MPERLSKEWDAGNRRVLDIGVFEHQTSRYNYRLVGCKAYLDNEGAVSRQKSIPIILESMDQVRKKWTPTNGPAPQLLLAGDFN